MHKRLMALAWVVLLVTPFLISFSFGPLEIVAWIVLVLLLVAYMLARKHSSEIAAATDARAATESEAAKLGFIATSNTVRRDAQ